MITNCFIFFGSSEVNSELYVIDICANKNPTGLNV